MFQAYTKHSQSTASVTLDTTKCILSTAIQENLKPDELMKRVEGLMQDTNSQADFLKFVECQSQLDDTWKFWSQFILSDCYAYIGLYLAIRGGNWRLRMSSLKQMAPLFAAFDRDSYQRIIPNHLAHLEEYPKQILQCLEAGGFMVNLTGRHWHSIAFDEAHEMCINKDLKTAIIRPTKSYLHKTNLFFKYRITSYKNLLQQLFPEKFSKSITRPRTILDKSLEAHHKEENI